MSKESVKMPKARPFIKDDSDFVPRYLGDEYKTPEALLRKAEEMRIFLTLNPLPEELMKRAKY